MQKIYNYQDEANAISSSHCIILKPSLCLQIHDIFILDAGFPCFMDGENGARLSYCLQEVMDMSLYFTV